MKTYQSLFLVLSVLLSSCVAAVLAGTAGSLVVYDRRSMTTIESDARIFHVVHTKIVQDPRFRDSKIDVSSFNQSVLLTGQTSSAELKTLAANITQQTPHVIRVFNEVTIQPPISLQQMTKDTWITSQIRTNMLTKKGLESGSIRIVTNNSEVFLMGLVTQEQAASAVDVARAVNGVSKVVKVFRYI